MPNADASPTREVAPFLRSLRAMVDAESDAILRWTDDGRAIEIHDVHALTQHVLPQYFKHAKYASFQRQLNYFHFRKWTKSRTAVCTFSNPHFQRDQPQLVGRIARKRGLSDAKHSPTAAAAALCSATTSAAVFPSAQPSNSATTRQRSHSSAADASCSSSASSGGDCDSEVETALDWIDALFPSLDMLSRLGGGDGGAFGVDAATATVAARRHTEPMPAQSYECVSRG